MNIERLKERLKEKDIFTYKELCEILDEKYGCGGNSKIKQLEDWNRYFEYSKNGTKFKITLIREKPLPDIDKTLSRSKYYSDLETLIMYALQNNNGYFKITPYVMLHYSNFVSDDYIDYIMCNDYENIRTFKDGLHKMMRNIFKNTIKKMENKYLIETLDNTHSEPKKVFYELKISPYCDYPKIELLDCINCRKNLRNSFISFLNGTALDIDKEYIISNFCSKITPFDFLKNNESFIFSPKRNPSVRKYITNINNTYNKAYVYKYVNDENEVVYVGKTKNLKMRLSQHSTAKDDNHFWHNDKLHIYYIELKEYGDCSIIEPYFIMKYHPIGNIDHNENNKSLIIDEFENLQWIRCL